MKELIQAPWDDLHTLYSNVYVFARTDQQRYHIQPGNVGKARHHPHDTVRIYPKYYLSDLI
jgi:hypothetical protein